MRVLPAKRLEGSITVPGDKSISHRAAMIAAMAEGTTVIRNYASGRDCASTLKCLWELGVPIEVSGTTVTITGVGKQGFQKPIGPLDCGNSGTTLRLLAGILAGQSFESVLTGDESLKKRPMNRIIAPLARMKAMLLSPFNTAPLKMRSRLPLRAIEYTPDVASAQVKSCIMLAGLNAEGSTRVIEPIPTRDHTERMLEWFGADLNSLGGSKLTARNVDIPGDISSAAFFIAAAGCLPGSRLGIKNVGINPTRTEFLNVLREIGVKIDIEKLTTKGPEPLGNITVTAPEKLSGKIHISGSKVGALIDEIPILAVAGTQVEGGIEVRDAGELRKKECDRISAIVENLTWLKAIPVEYSDGFSVERTRLRGQYARSFGDHRIAMAFAVAALLAENSVLVQNAECVDISYPGFFDILESVTKR
ncbi:MAG: 3-phosphoshikimate 1-carboxyvinyltransferase [Acidobacteriota bacterium]|nr:MAG: 3-phosphoshikimate 1-carboxyvinyltransferase [Acidobacteriota bacterium]